MFKLQDQQQMQNSSYQNMDKETLKSILKQACTKIAPVWPLENFVAVNPYFGMTDLKFHEVAGRLSKLTNTKMTLPIEYYLKALDEGKFTKQDIATAIQETELPIKDDVESFLNKCQDLVNSGKAILNKEETLSTVIDLASEISNIDWGSFAVERISSWSSVYFDQGQAIWNSTDSSLSPFQSWLEEAIIDRMPSIMGLSGFRPALQRLPKDALSSTYFILNHLGIPEEARDLYLHKLLLRVIGWSSYAAKLVFENALYGKSDESDIEFLSILLAWEYAVYESFTSDQIAGLWKENKKKLSAFALNSDLTLPNSLALILQSSLEHFVQKNLISDLNSVASKMNSKSKTDPNKEKNGNHKTSQPDVQAIFCIDVSSEVFRRNLESVSSSIETLGFAGFFAFPIDYYAIGHSHGATQCPVLLTPAVKIAESLPKTVSLKNAIQKRTLKMHVRRAWNTFKMGAVSCFSFVGPIGLIYLPKLFTDGFGWTRPVPHPDLDGLSSKENSLKSPSIQPIGTEDGYEIHTGIPLENRIKMATGALKAMSLTSNFAKLVLITGHGSTTVNNPHSTGLDCGACGGRTGEVNAKVASLVLNDKDVRKALIAQGIQIPKNTLFLACQHDTTTDQVTIFDRNLIPSNRKDELDKIEKSLALAGKLSRLERSKRMSLPEGENPDLNIFARTKDWAQVRPEWGLAGCSAFIAAPRNRTEGLDLAGKSFLHSYDWKLDQGYGVLELILTAPVVVASWISLQYYGSTVDNKVFGSGNKTLHNVVSGIGVLEGNGGDLRIGLPWQSVHDGQNYQHEPVRLNVVIEAPIEAINSILSKHTNVRNLFDNGWLHLFVINEEGRVGYKYDQNLSWKSLN